VALPLGERRRIDEPRLEERVCELLQRRDIALYEPPVNLDDPRSPFAGMNAFIFPAWFLARVDEEWTDKLTGRTYRSRPLVTWSQLTEGKWLDTDRKKVEVVPVRFVQACVRGHISDINWYAFVYRDWSAGRKGLLGLDEGGAGNDFADIYVRCEATGVRRRLSDAKVPEAKVLGSCNGLRPWLGGQSRERDCQELTRLLVRSATNAYFSQTLGVISIPDMDEALRDAVSGVWEDFLQYCESAADVARERKKQRVAVAIEKYTNAQVWAHIEVRQSPTPPPAKGIKQLEIEMLLGQPDSVGEDRPEGDFYARNRPLTGVGGPLSPMPGWLADRIDRVVLVHRLREVIAQVGFTRFEPEEPDIDGMLDINVKRGALALDTTWVPAIANKGEGVLITFKTKAIEDWLNRREVGIERGGQLLAGYQAHAKRKGILGVAPPRGTLPYIMLHSLSHLLIIGGVAGVWVRGKLDPRAHLRHAERLRHPALHRHAGGRGHPRRPGPGGPAHRAASPDRAGDWSPLLERPRVRLSSPRRHARGAVPARSGVPRLPAHRRDVVRAAQRDARPCPRDPHRAHAGRRLLRAHAVSLDRAAVGLPELEALAAALETGRLRLPLTHAGLERYLPTSEGRAALAVIERLDFSARQTSALLRMVAAELRRTQRQTDRVELVWTGPEVDEASGDTAVVVRDLFRRARHTVLVASFAIDSGGKAEALFGELAARMDADPHLRVRMFLNIHRDKSDEPDAAIVRTFARTFREKVWPGSRLPAVYYDPRALSMVSGPRACLHAKCVVADDERAFVTSANFTEAAHGRNIEAGVLIEDATFARGVREQFDALVEAGRVKVMERSDAGLM
jgi:hypothetical protein